MCYQGVKKTKFVEAFKRIVCLPHVFDHGQNRKVIAFCKSSEMEDIARNAGAHFAGGKQLIKQIQVRYYRFLQHITIAYGLAVFYMYLISHNKLAKIMSCNK